MMEKRLLALLLSVCMLTGWLPIAASADDMSGTPVLSAEGYYQLQDAADLLWFAAQVNSGNTALGAQLTADIDMTSVAWTPIGSSAAPYAGQMDGAGHTIRNLTYAGDLQYVGLIGYMQGASVRNVHIVDCQLAPVNPGDVTGAICGYAVDSTISGCSITGNACLRDAYIAGGICGYAISSSISRCTNAACVAGDQEDSQIGGICGYGDTSELSYCANTGAISLNNAAKGEETSCAGGIVGKLTASDSANIHSCYNLGEITVQGSEKKSYGAICGNSVSLAALTACCCLEGTIGIANTSIPQYTSDGFASGAAAYLLNDLFADETAVWRQSIGTDAYPVLDDTHPVIYCGEDGSYYNVQPQHVCSFDSDGFCRAVEGVIHVQPPTLENDSYQLTNAGNLYWLAQQVNSGNCTLHAVLQHDIIIPNNAPEWEPMGTEEHTFQGSLDGNGHSISGLHITGHAVHAGLIGVNRGTITELMVSDAYVSVSEQNGVQQMEVGLLVGKNAGGVISYCCASGSVIAEGFDDSNCTMILGGLCGKNEADSTIFGSYSMLDQIVGSGSSNYLGGICGSNSGSVQACCYQALDGIADEAATSVSDFSTGEAVWILNGGEQQLDSPVWGQTLAGDGKQHVPTYGGAPVYSYTNCGETVRLFTNDVALEGTVQDLVSVTDDAVAPTCTEAGKTEGSHCSVCHAVITAQKDIPAKGHTEAIDEAVAATCTTAGKTEGSHCSVCGTVIQAQETIPAKGHTEVTDAAVAATCTTAGKTKGIHCSVCGTVLKAQETIPAKGHTEVSDAAVAATCTTAGKTEGRHCSVCNEVIQAQEEIPAKGHIEVTDAAVAATCTTAGKTEGIHCSVCGTVLKAQETIPAKGHTEVTDTAVAATCTTAGKTEGSHCAVCDAVLKAQEDVPAKGHTEVTDAAVAATCTENGKTEGSHCSVCGTVLKAQETIPAKGHKVVTDAAVAATCTTAGKTEGSHCAVCDAVLKAQETIPAKGHTEVTDEAVAATCTTAGKTEGSHCSVCDAVITAQKDIPAKGHIEVTDAAVAATCTTAGKTEGSHCSVCGTVIQAQETIPAKGHTEVTDAAVAATCTTAGKTKGIHCSVCGTVLKAQETIPAKGHIEVTDAAVAATCTTAGKTEGSHCSVCGTVIQAQETIPAKGHTEVTDVAVAATCTTAGKTEGSHCSVCDAVIKAQETIPAKGHTEVTDAAVAATCTTAGKTEGSHCSVCDAVIQAQETIPAKGHTAVTDAAVAATCTTAGKTEGSHCSVCQEVIKIQETVPATGHIYGKPSWVWASDYSSARAVFTCVHDSRHTRTMTAMLSVQTTAATTTATGRTVHTASVQLDGTTYRDTRSVTIPMVEKPVVQERLDIQSGLSDVPEGLQHTAFHTIDAIERELLRIAAQHGYTANQTAIFDMTLQVSEDGGKSWHTATAENFPKDGLTVIVPYPEGTNAEHYDFHVVHMFGEAVNGHQPGEIETPAFTKTAEGLRFVVDGLSPIAVSWRKTACDGGAACPSRAFADTDVTAWYHLDVDYVIEAGLMNGYGNGKFGPNDTLSRAQLAQILYNHAGAPAVKGTSVYMDVTAGKWYTNAVVWATQEQLVLGYGNGRFGPNDSITREQMATILWRMAGKPDTDVSLERFHDAKRVSAFAVEAMQWAVQSKIIQGNTNGNLMPKQAAGRAQVAAIVHRFLLRENQ